MPTGIRSQSGDSEGHQPRAPQYGGLMKLRANGRAHGNRPVSVRQPGIFLESPWPWIVLGIVAEALLAAVLATTREGKLLWAMAGALVFMVAGVVVKRLVVTERERVEAAMEGIVAALNANDVNPLLIRHVAPDAATPRARAS